MKITALAALAGLAIASPAKAGDQRSASQVQDPPGRVAVDQPAGVAFEDRDTPRDTTDPMHGSTYGDLRKARSMEVVTTESSTAQPRPGRDVRASQDEPTRSSTGTPETSLGTDIGYGTGTEPQPPQR